MARPAAILFVGLTLGYVACDSPPPAALSLSIDSTFPAAGKPPPEYWAVRLRSDSVSVRREALGQLGTYGSAAGDYAPAIARHLSDPDDKTGFTAAWSLAHIGMTAHPFLIEHLEDNRPAVRERAAYGLGEVGPDAIETAERLQKLESSDPSSKVRNMAAWALDEVARQRVVADRWMTLLEGVQGSPEERFEATRRLGFNAKVNSPAIPALIRLLGDSLPAVRLGAIEALAKAGPVALPALSAALGHRSSTVRSGAMLALSRMQRGF